MNTTFLWDLKGTTDPQMIKSVPQAGGRKMSAIDTYYKLKTITEVFGPMGVGWGIDIKSVQCVPCKIWGGKEDGRVAGTMMIVHCTFWYRIPNPLVVKIWDEMDNPAPEFEDRCEFDMLNNISLDANEDACKSLLTDTITKAASYLGFHNDVFMGAFDGDRYLVEKMAKADDSMKDEFLRLFEEVKALGYPQDKLDKMLDYHERQGYITASVKPDVLGMSKWIIKHKGASSGGPADPLGS